MQKVYLLLRNNKQTGPHSLDELLQLGLQPFDLIWVEGKSGGWSYPSEIDTLKPFLPAGTQGAIPEKKAPLPAPAQPKKIFVSMPPKAASAAAESPATQSIEEKAEALRRRAQSYQPAAPATGAPLTTNLARSLEEVEQDYTSWMVQNRQKRKPFMSPKAAAVTAIIAIGLLGGWLAGRAVFSPKVPVVAAATQKTIMPVEESSAPSAEGTATEEITSASASTTPSVQKSAAVSPVPKKGPAHNALPDEKPEQATASAPDNTPAATPSVPVTVQAPVEEAPVTGTASAPKEKKKLRDIIGGIFKKKKEPETAEAPEGASTTVNGERRGSKRGGEESTAPSLTDISSEVSLKLNRPSGEWMMGVKGASITLTNRSSATLKTAEVEVLYYSEENSLLDKKTIRFSAVPPRKSQTVAAPDHRMADHIEFRLVSATGSDAAYARQ